MNWIRLESGWERDPRLRILRSRLGNEPAATMLPLRLWCICADFYRDGTISGEALDALPDMLEWTGDRAAMLAALEVAGYIRREGQGIEVEGWDIIFGLAKSYRDRVAALNKARLSKPPPAPPSGDSTDRTNIQTASRASSRTSSREDEGFQAFWKQYPKQGNKEEAAAEWAAIAPDAQTVARILHALEVFKRSPDWTKDLGKWITNPAKWLSKRKWELVPEAKAKGATPFAQLSEEIQRQWHEAVIAQAKVRASKPDLADPKVLEEIIADAHHNCRIYHRGDYERHAEELGQRST